jgi:O-antigen/teichoic acid export membrane protein
MLACTGIIALLGYTFSMDIISMIYGSGLLDASTPFRILIFAVIFLGLERLCMTTLISMGLQRIVFLTTLVGAILNVSLNLAVIPRFGYVGASYSTLITEIVVFVMAIFFILRKYRHG